MCVCARISANVHKEHGVNPGIYNQSGSLHLTFDLPSSSLFWRSNTIIVAACAVFKSIEDDSYHLEKIYILEDVYQALSCNFTHVTTTTHIKPVKYRASETPTYTDMN